MHDYQLKLCLYNIIVIIITGLVEIVELPGIVITEYELVILGGECAWLLPYEDQFPTLDHVQYMCAFINIVR